MAEDIVCLAILESGERKKMTLRTGNYDEVVAALSAITSVTDSTLIQIYDEILEDFIDMEKDAFVQHKGKLKVARKLVLQSDDSARPAVASIDAGASPRSDSSTPSTSGLETVAEAVPLQNKNDYLYFILPSFAPYEEILERKVPINGRVRRAVIDRLFQACVKIVWLPSKLLYRTAVERLLTRYPHLKDDIEDQSGMESWVLGLRSKFKNMRKKTEHPSEEMETIKRKAHHTGTKVPPSSGANKKLCRLFDCSHLVVRGESLDSIMRHNEWLHNNPNCRDEDMLRPRLLATAQERHERLKSMALAEALTLYPFLSTEVSLLVEFETLFKRAAVDCVQDGCTKMGKVILDKGTSEEAAAFSEVASEEPVLAVLEFVAARCREQLDTILTTEATELTPCLVRSSDQALDLFVDGQRLFAVSNLLEGVACLFASFWVFHIEYPKKACKLLTFLEHGFMGLSHTKPRVKALELINFFKAHKQ